VVKKSDQPLTTLSHHPLTNSHKYTQLSRVGLNLPYCRGELFSQVAKVSTRSNAPPRNVKLKHIITWADYVVTSSLLSDDFKNMSQ